MVYLRPNGRWYCDFYLSDGQRYRRSLGPEIQSERAAERAAKDLLLRLEDEIARRNAAPDATPRRPSAAFSGFAAHWLETHVRTNLKPSVALRYESMIRVHLVPMFGDRDLASITEHDVEEAKARWARTPHPDTGRPLAPKTVNEHLGVLASMLQKAVDWGYLRSNPARRVKPLRVPPREDRWLREDEAARFLAACQAVEPEWYPLLYTALHTGMRLGELLALEWSCVDPGQGIVTVLRSRTRGETTSPKGHRARRVKVARGLPEFLLGLPRRHPRLVFAREDGAEISADMLKAPFARVVKAAGVRRVTVHDLRHTYASLLVSRGVPLPFVQRQLGHTDIKITMRYAHLAPEAGDDWIARLPLPAPAWAQTGHSGTSEKAQPVEIDKENMVEAAGIFRGRTARAMGSPDRGDVRRLGPGRWREAEGRRGGWREVAVSLACPAGGPPRSSRPPRDPQADAGEGPMIDSARYLGRATPPFRLIPNPKR